LSVSIPEWPRVDLSDMPAVMTAKQVGPFFNKSPEQLANERHLKKGVPYTKIGAAFSICAATSRRTWLPTAWVVRHEHHQDRHPHSEL
jgi:hypothetical protein